MRQKDVLKRKLVVLKNTTRELEWGCGERIGGRLTEGLNSKNKS